MKQWNREAADACFAKVNSLLSLSEDGMQNGWCKWWFIRVRTYVPWIRKCVTKTIGYETSHKYTNCTEFLHFNNTLHILEHSIIDHLYTKRNHLQSRSVHIHRAALHCVFSAFRIITLHDNLLKILMTSYDALFSFKKTRSVGIWSVKMALILCISIVYR